MHLTQKLAAHGLFVCAAAGALLVARTMLACAPGRALRWSARRPASVEPDTRVHEAARAIGRAAARAPLSFTCLEQAIALVLVLAAMRRSGRVVLGVDPGRDAFRAHAWVDCGGRIVLGADPAERLFPLDAVRRPARQDLQL